MDPSLATLVQLLDATLDPSKQRQAEKELKSEEKKPQFSISLLKIVASNDLPINTRLAGALCFKNFIRFNYVDENGNYKIPLDEVTIIKKELITLMIQCPAKIQTQLGEAISVIAESDFWERWDSLVQDLVSQLSPTDPKVNIGVLEVAHSIFQRWRPLYRSDDLYTEINHVLNTFALPFIEMLQVVDRNIEANANNKDALKGWFEALSLLVKLFFDLSCQDMPPQFEEHLKSLSALLHKYLVYTNPLLVTDDDSEVSILETVKADICEAIELYTSKFDDEFGSLLEPFISSAWNLLSTTGPETKYDILISKALHFLTAVASSQRHAGIFNDEGVLNQIVEKVILPNVALRESDIEMFEDEPIEFIRRDLEGSDNDSRRRSATDFLRKLQERFEQRVTAVVSKYIEHFITQGKTDWKAKDTAVYLFIAVAAKGSVTAAQGVKTVNSLVNVVEFFQNNIANDLMAADVEPIAKVDAIKYLYTFRSQLSKEQWSAAFTPLIQNLGSDNYVVYTYAAITVERVLFLSNDQGVPLFTREDIQPFAKDLLDHLFKLIQKESSPQKMQENEFLMRCVMRVIIVLKDSVVPMAEDVLNHLITITNTIKANPSNPRFYYYHFEALGAIVRFCAPTASSKLEERLWEPFFQILTEEVTEFMPYVFQVLAALLESNPSGTLSDNYKGLMGPILSPAVWETRGNVPGCARLLTAVIPRASQYILAQNQLEQVLGIFQRLISGKKTEANGFDILESIVASFPSTNLDAYFKEILTIVLTKLDASPSDSFKQRFVRFYHVVSSRADSGLGADYFIRHVDTIGDNLFVPVYLKIILPATELLVRPVDRKTAVVSFTKTLTDSKAFAERYKKGWVFTCQSLLALLQNPPKVSAGAGDDMITEADVDDIGFGLGFTQLNTCRQAARDDFGEIQDVQKWVSDFLKAANGRTNGAVFTYANERLPDDVKAAIAPYLQ